MSVRRFIATFSVPPGERSAVLDVVSSTARAVRMLVDYIGPAGVGFEPNVYMVKVDGPEDVVAKYGRWFDGRISRSSLVNS